VDNPQNNSMKSLIRHWFFLQKRVMGGVSVWTRISAMPYKLIFIGTPICIAFGASIASYAEEKTAMALTQLVGATFLLVMIFAHVSEAFGFIPSLGWGRPNTLGHYIDLVSAIAGSILLPIGYLGRRYARRIKSN
jgi:hypothetical protein